MMETNKIVIIIVCSLVCILFLLLILGGGFILFNISDMIPKKTSETIVETNKTEEYTPEISIIPKKSPQIYKIGESFKINNVIYTINGSRDKTKANLPELKKELNNNSKFIVVNMTLKNMTNETLNVYTEDLDQFFDPSSLQLIDLENNQYNEPNVIAEIDFLTGKVGPGRKLTGEIMFKVPLEKKVFFLEINQTDISDTTIVKLD